MKRIEFERGQRFLPCITCSGSGINWRKTCEAAQSELAALREELAKFDEGMRALACSLAAGGYNAETLTADQLVGKVQWGIDNIITGQEQRLTAAEQRNAMLLALLRAARNCHNSPGIGNKDAWVYHRIDGRINEALNEQRGIVYQSREIGESGWTDCDKDWYDHCAKDPHMESRITPTESGASE